MESAEFEKKKQLKKQQQIKCVRPLQAVLVLMYKSFPLFIFPANELWNLSVCINRGFGRGEGGQSAPQPHSQKTKQYFLNTSVFCWFACLCFAVLQHQCGPVHNT